MKKILFVLSLFCSVSLVAQTTFGPVEKHAFGPLQGNYGYNRDVMDLAVFKGKIYAGMGVDSGYIYRSASGDMATFSKVFSQYNATGVFGFATTANNGGYMFAATQSTYFGYYPEVKRTYDGVNWVNYFSTSGYYDEIETVNTFKGLQSVDSVYVAVRVSGYNLLLRNSVLQSDPYNTNFTWDTVASMTSAFGMASQVEASIVFNNKLYYSTFDDKLFVTDDGRSLIQSIAYDTTMGVLSTSGVDRVTAMEVFGGYLYLGTSGSNGSAQLWRTADGITFDSLGVMDVNYSIVRGMRAAGGKLFMTISDPSGNFIMYSTSDGTTYNMEDNTRLGDPNSNVSYESPMVTFNNHLYVGVCHDLSGFRYGNNGGGNQVQYNYTTGGKIYRACMSGALPTVTITNPDTTIVCAGTSVTLNASGNAVSYLWSNANNTAFLSTATPGHYAVTGVSAAGCRNSDDAYILNSSVVPPIVIKNHSQIYNEVICGGDTTLPITAVDPNRDYNCLVSTATTPGSLATPNSFVFDGNDLTIEAWIYPTGANGVIANEFDPGNLWSFGHNAIMYLSGTGDQLNVNLQGVGSTSVGYVTPNQWNHVVLRYNNTTRVLDGLVNGYQGGYAYSGALHTPPSFFGYSDAYEFFTASTTPFFGNSFVGKIRDVRVWKVARTDSAIVADKYVLPATSHANLVYYYKVLETSGTTVADSSGNSFNGTVTGNFEQPNVVNWITVPSMNHLGFNTAEFFPTQPTSYAMQYTNANGCVVTDSFKVEPAQLHIGGSPTASCGGAPAMLFYNSNASISFPTWSSTSIGTLSTTSLTVTPASNEWVYATSTATTSTGTCAVNDSLLVKVGPAFVTTLGTEPPIIACENTDVVLHAQPSGGTAPYTFYWILGATTDTTTADSLIHNIGNTSHSVYLSGHDAIGCYFQTGGFNGYFITPTNSTDLFGHVSTIASANVDNGYVYVFKHQPGTAGLDTVGYTSLNSNGDYLFVPLTAGNYLVKVLPDATAFPNSVPTYYGNAFQWDSSLVYTHGCLQTDTANIQIVETLGNSGTASISGYIIEEAGFGSGRYGSGGNNTPFVPGGPLKGIDVKLGKNPGGGIQARTMSDSTGFYHFDAVPNGGYRIYVDIPNLPMDSTREITVASGDSSIQNNYFADSASIYINPNTIGIHTINSKVFENKFTLYPNPAKSIVYLSYDLQERSKLSFEVTNTLGQVVIFEKERNYPEGKNTFVLDLDRFNLTGGVYFVSLISGDKKYTQRMVIID